MPRSRCPVSTSSACSARAISRASRTAVRARSVKWGSSSSPIWLSTVCRTAATRFADCSSARWQIADTGIPEARTASASSSGRYTLIFGMIRL
ncbi:hypothetical protein ACFQV2_19315 [Actinokineospora soli]|uniref:Uncharacterized protein n=1 Tax=Actinokineospora soli TaxID=1048753 RepID=A0ABW2TNF4_9PSEU